MTRALARAPGRVNLIGEHTDYNDGFVMPIALECSTFVDASARSDRRLRVASESYPGEAAEFDLDALPEGPQQRWPDCVRGMALELEREGVRFPGAELRISSTIPIGAGLSSSAALEIATGLTLLRLAGADLDRVTLARVAQRAENCHMGTRSGIMDQFTIANARAGSALLLDTRALTFTLLPLAPDLRVLVFDTMVRHRHATGEYNRRREECERGVAALRERFSHVHALRDAQPAQLEAVRDEIGAVVYRRCRHIVSENARVLAAADALRADDRAAFGTLLNASHASLRDDYEVSCAELDTMVEIAQRAPGVYGARMTGGGFGGCAIALAGASDAEAIVAHVRREYASATGKTPNAYVATACAGAELLPVPAEEHA